MRRVCTSVCSVPYSIPRTGGKWAPISVPRLCGLGALFFLLVRNTPFDLSLSMILRRSKRTPVPRTIWEEKGAPSSASDPKITKKPVRTEQETAFKPITIDPLPETAELDEKDLLELPMYEPPLNLQFQTSKSLATGLSELQTFQQLLTSQIIDRIVTVTNSYVTNVRNT